MTPIIGIDPGQTGALALYTPAIGSLDVQDIPTLRVNGKTVIDHYGLARIIDAWSGAHPEVWLEFVSSSSQMGVSSAFKFGETYGLIRGVLSANFLRVQTVTPASWKRAMKVGADKDSARAAACNRFPRHSGLFARKMDHGRAEAALIAAYGAEQRRKVAA